MLTSELKKRQNLILLNDNEANYILYPLTKEEADEINELLEQDNKEDARLSNYDFMFVSRHFISTGICVDMCGNIQELKPIYVANLIPKKTVHTIKEGNNVVEKITEYKCYQEHHYDLKKKNNIIIHEDKLSSFVCACQRLQTKYFIVLKERCIPLGEGIMAQLERHKDFPTLTLERLKDFINPKEEQNGDNQDRDTEVH